MKKAFSVCLTILVTAIINSTLCFERRGRRRDDYSTGVSAVLPEEFVSELDLIRKTGYTYIDKTKFVYKLIKQGGCYFMSRPRKFGKTLLLDVFMHVFEGKKKLFNDTYIMETDYDWPIYPVLRFSFFGASIDFENDLNRQLSELMVYHNVADTAVDNLNDSSSRLHWLIEELAGGHLEQVVVLVDRYDAPISHSAGNSEVARRNRRILICFFATLKNLVKYMRFVFVTGLSSISLGLGDSVVSFMHDITMDPDFADMLGFTSEEMRRQLKEPIKEIALRINPAAPDVENVYNEMCQWYNGYCFSKKLDLKVHNPHSVAKYLLSRDGRGRAYWYDKAKRRLLPRILKNDWEQLKHLNGTRVFDYELLRFNDLNSLDARAILFQNGYLTIKDYNERTKQFILDYPNEEVKSRFERELENEIEREMTNEEHWHYWFLRNVGKMKENLINFQYSKFVKFTNAYFKYLSYRPTVDGNNELLEHWYQRHFVQYLKSVDSSTIIKDERKVGGGRVDVALTRDFILYIFQLKRDARVENALDHHTTNIMEPYNGKYDFVVVMVLAFSTKSGDIYEYTYERWDKDGIVMDGPSCLSITDVSN